ncbi:unnamed protein product [Linum trigynum]|uniref:Uncharacterized protein n=1 Tax=Linum trigynum TaxID=586398 RepID=A0AAV2C608_9ROSI
MRNSGETGTDTNGLIERDDEDEVGDPHKVGGGEDDDGRGSVSLWARRSGEVEGEARDYSIALSLQNGSVRPIQQFGFLGFSETETAAKQFGLNLKNRNLNRQLSGWFWVNPKNRTRPVTLTYNIVT